MSSFAHRRPSREERWVAAHETLVASLHGGHETSVDEYANDLSCRQSLEDNREDGVPLTVEGGGSGESPC